MNHQGKRHFFAGMVLVALFAILTWLVQTVDVQPLGVNGTNVGLYTLNAAFHRLWGVNMALYTITDWAGLVPIAVTLSFAVKGLVQLIGRKSLLKVDADILILGGYYLVVAALYVAYEMIPINYRPVLINGMMEASYPSSTTLLVLGVMPACAEQIRRRSPSSAVKTAVTILTAAFSGLMVLGRLVSGVHWLTDILGAVLISAGLFHIYRGLVLMFINRH